MQQKTWTEKDNLELHIIKSMYRLKKDIKALKVILMIIVALCIIQAVRPQPVKQVVVTKEKPIENKLVELPNLKNINYYIPKK